jgi:lipopolysaccharide biosynthesis regulator YciM
MYSTETILESVLSIYPRLEELLGETTAQKAKEQLLHLLIQMQAEQPVENQLLDLLAQYEPTREVMKTLLNQYSNDPSTLDISDFINTDITQQPTKVVGFAPLPGSAFAPLPGDITYHAKPQFKCPNCDYTWSRLKLGKPTPICPTHQILLKPILL